MRRRKPASAGKASSAAFTRAPVSTPSGHHPNRARKRSTKLVIVLVHTDQIDTGEVRLRDGEPVVVDGDRRGTLRIGTAQVPRAVRGVGQRARERLGTVGGRDREELRLMVVHEVLEEERVVVELGERQRLVAREVPLEVLQHRQAALHRVAEQRERAQLDAQSSHATNGKCPVYIRICLSPLGRQAEQVRDADVREGDRRALACRPSLG